MHKVMPLLLALLLAACGHSGTDKTAEQAIQIADNLRKSGDQEGALRVLAEAEAKQPADHDLLNALGYALINAGQPEAAVRTFDKLIGLAPNDAMAYNGKGVAFDHAGNHLAAQELYKQALKISPDSVAVRNNLGMSLILGDQLKEAIAVLKPLSEEPGASRTTRQNLALAYALKGYKAKALAINMKDLPPEQAKENMAFYEQYAQQHQHAKTPASSGIGFTETPMKEKESE